MENISILFICENDSLFDDLRPKFKLLRDDDGVWVCNLKNYKKQLENLDIKILIINADDYSKKELLKIIEYSKNQRNECEILLMTDKSNAEDILEYYDDGIFDYFSAEIEPWQLMIKLVNAFRSNSNKVKEIVNGNFFEEFDILDSKTGLYKHKAVAQIFDRLDMRQKGIFCIISLDESIKTRVSVSRLSTVIKNNIRNSDIGIAGKSGTFYILLPSSDILKARSLIEKIQFNMGSDYPIHSGVVKIGFQDFNSVYKNAKDSLLCAVQNNELCASLTDKIGNNWLDDEKDSESKKHFKLFHKLYKSKMDTIITPLFFRYQKSCETKFKSAKVSQYTNEIESVFNVRCGKNSSEVTIHYNGFTKLYIEISHKGLDSLENSQYEFDLKSFSERDLNRILKKFLAEFEQSFVND